MSAFTRPSWLEIDVGALVYNLKEVKKRMLPGQQMMCVVKANAYGHGLQAVSRALARKGADGFGVISLDEAVAVQEAGIDKPILIMGYTPPSFIAEAAERGLEQVVFSYAYARALSAQLHRGQKLKVHLKIDTGMGRLGVLPDEAGKVMQKIRSLAGLEVVGICTHLCSAEENEELTKRQIETFLHAVPDNFRGYVHAANSAGLLFFQRPEWNLVRVGIMLYGYYPFRKNAPPPFARALPQLKPVLSLKSRLISIKTLPKGHPVSYGATFITHRPMRAGVVPVGYADGVSRHLSNKLDVTIRAQRARIIGRICMDFLMVDLSSVKGACVGDEVVLLGKRDEGYLDADHWAEITQTISYEVLTSFCRLPRAYVNEV